MSATKLLLLPEIAARYRKSTRSIRRAIATRDGSIPPPCMDHPYRWREADVERHIATSSLVETRRIRMRRLRVAS